MKPWVKEVLWFVGTFVVAYLLFDPSLSFDFAESTVDINVHDTYFVIEGSHILILITIACFFAIYLCRMLIYRFKNFAVNIIFMVANALQVLSLVGIANMVKAFLDMFPEQGYYISQSPEGFKPLYYTLIILSVLLAALEVFTLYKTITLYRKTKTSSQA